jgi:hypothetical protein
MPSPDGEPPLVPGLRFERSSHGFKGRHASATPPGKGRGALARSRTASCDVRSVAAQSLGEGVVSLGGVEPTQAPFVAGPPESAGRDRRTRQRVRVSIALERGMGAPGRYRTFASPFRRRSADPSAGAETCFGVAPNRSAFAARSARTGAARHGASTANRTPTSRLGRPACNRYTLLARAGPQGIAPCSEVLEASLRLSLGPTALPTGVEPVSPLRQRGCDTGRIRQRLRRALVANRTRTHRLRRPRAESIGESVG